MTRRTLKRQLRQFVFVLLFIISLAAFAKFSPLFGFERQGWKTLYEFINDMSLLIFTIGAAYLANVFQRRANFVTSLKEEWHEIVRAKSSLICYIDNPERDHKDYLHAVQHLSQCIDYMRIVYGNVGETDSLIGKYPYEPLHDMRRALQMIDPFHNGPVSNETLSEARKAIWEGFNALRERFLEELDLETPEHPIINEGARRQKKVGAHGF